MTGVGVYPTMTPVRRRGNREPTMLVGLGDLGDGVGFDLTATFRNRGGTGVNASPNGNLGTFIDRSQVSPLTVADYIAANSIASALDIPGFHATAADNSMRPILSAAGDAAVFIDVAVMSITAPAEGFTGTLITRTALGEVSYLINVPGGTDLTFAGAFDEGGVDREIRSTIIFAERLSEGAADRWITRRYGSQNKYAGLTNASALFAGMYFVTRLPSIDLTGSANVTSIARDCVQLTAIPSGWDFSQSSFISNAFANCTALVDVPTLVFPGGATLLNVFDGCTSLSDLTAITLEPGCVNMSGFARNCALSEASVDHILGQLVANGDSGGTISLENGTNAAPSATGLADVATLQSRGWTVSHN